MYDNALPHVACIEGSFWMMNAFIPVTGPHVPQTWNLWDLMYPKPSSSTVDCPGALIQVWEEILKTPSAISSGVCPDIVGPCMLPSNSINYLDEIQSKIESLISLKAI